MRRCAYSEEASKATETHKISTAETSERSDHCVLPCVFKCDSYSTAENDNTIQ